MSSMQSTVMTGITYVAAAGGVYGIYKGLEQFRTYIAGRERRVYGNELVDGIMNTSIDTAHLFGYSLLNGMSGAALAVASPFLLPWYYYRTSDTSGEHED